MDTTITIRFPEAELAHANQYAQDLARDLRELDGVQIERRRERDDAQDLGSILVLILGTSSVTALGHGLAAWLWRNSGVKIEVDGPDGRKTRLTNVTSKDASSIVKAIFGQSTK